MSHFCLIRSIYGICPQTTTTKSNIINTTFIFSAIIIFVRHITCFRSPVIYAAGENHFAVDRNISNVCIQQNNVYHINTLINLREARECDLWHSHFHIKGRFHPFSSPPLPCRQPTLQTLYESCSAVQRYHREIIEKIVKHINQTNFSIYHPFCRIVFCLCVSDATTLSSWHKSVPIVFIVWYGFP